jgi:ABC-type transporter Mla subunit MlaD
MIEKLKKTFAPILLAITVMFGGTIKAEYDRLIGEIQTTKQRVDDLLKQSSEMVNKVNQMIDAIQIRLREENSDERSTNSVSRSRHDGHQYRLRLTDESSPG